MRGQRGSSSGRRLAPSLLALSVLAVACGDDSTDLSGRDGGPDGGRDEREDAGVPESCDLRCEPEESWTNDCRCTQEGVRMRLGELSDGFYAQPWPLQSRLDAGGNLVLTDFPFAPGADFIRTNLPLIERATSGFSTNGAIFMSFDGAIDGDTLPDAEQSLQAGAGVYLIEVDRHSDTRGERTPIECSFRAEESSYTPPNLLACAPVPGFPLRPATAYALVVTDAVRDVSGGRLRASQRLRDVLAEREAGDDALAGELRAAYDDLGDWLAGEPPSTRAHIVGATEFHTQDPTEQMRKLAEDVRDQPAPVTTDIALYAGALPTESGNYVALEGTYSTPIYQQGDTPYAVTGGDIRFAADGAPERAAPLQLRFALTLPVGAMPPGGWPVALYHHGSAGDAYSFIVDGTAFRLAAAGVAMIGIDAPVHGTRKPAALDPDLLFFNITNVLALRDNIRQGAVDLLALERFVAGFELSAAQSPTGSAIRFDPDRVFAMGHSLGGLTVPIMLPFAEHVRGVMLSGSGASITASILYKTQPLDIPSVARTFLAIGGDEPFDAFHPVLALVQDFSDVSDPVNYAPYAYRWPGGRGADIWATQGLADEFAPKQVTDALVTAYGLQPLIPVFEPVEGLTLRDIRPVRSPARANVEGVDGDPYTGVYSQYQDADHFLIMNSPAAERQLTHWFQTLAEDGRGELLAP